MFHYTDLLFMYFRCSAGVGIGPLSKSVLMKSTCRNTMSQSWYIGNAILKARKEHVCPVKTLVQEANGKLLFNGKVISYYVVSSCFLLF